MLDIVSEDCSRKTNSSTRACAIGATDEAARLVLTVGVELSSSNGRFDIMLHNEFFG